MPYNCKVTFSGETFSDGWISGSHAFEQLIAASAKEFLNGIATAGNGSSSSNLSLLQDKYPEAAIFVTGASMTRDRLNSAYCKKLTGSLSHSIAAISSH